MTWSKRTDRWTKPLTIRSVTALTISAIEPSPTTASLIVSWWLETTIKTQRRKCPLPPQANISNSSLLTWQANHRREKKINTRKRCLWAKYKIRWNRHSSNRLNLILRYCRAQVQALKLVKANRRGRGEIKKI